MGTTFSGGGVVGDADLVRFRNLRVWSERGMIHWEDQRNNSYDCVSVRVALQRGRALGEMLGNSTRREMFSEDGVDQAFREEHVRFLERLAALCEKAKVQGMPSDPSARRDLVRRRPVSVVVPGYGGGL